MSRKHVRAFAHISVRHVVFLHIGEHLEGDRAQLIDGGKSRELLLPEFAVHELAGSDRVHDLKRLVGLDLDERVDLVG